MEKFEGLEDIEIIKLINKKKSKYCAIALSDYEEEFKAKMTPGEFKVLRKILLDNMNSFTRGVFTVIGISIEGVDD